MSTIWGIDMGGTKIEGAVLSPDYKVIARRRLPTEQQHGYQHIISQISKVIEILKTETGESPTTIGFSTPGTLDPILGTMKNSNTVCLNGQPLKTDLEKILGIPVQLANDANCFALAETKMGIVPDIMPDAKVVFGVIMGTGVGGGLVINGQVLNGRQGIGGEWGHNFLDISGGDCYCGSVGCTENVLSGPALQRFYYRQSGIKKPMKEIIELARIGEDKAAVNTLNRLIYFFGKGISTIINVIDPDIVVIGGGLGNIDELYSLGVEAIHPHIFNHRVDTVFVKPKLGDSAGVFGGAMLVS